MDVSVKAIVSGFEEAKQGLSSVSDGLDKIKDSAAETSGSSGVGGLTDAFMSLEGAGKLVAVALGATLVAAVGLAASRLKDAVVETTELGDKLSNLSQITGTSVEKLSSLKLAAEISNLSIDSLSHSIVLFARNIEGAQDGTGKTADALDRLGISLKDADGHLKTSEQLLSDVADRFQRMENGTTKSTLAMDLFGRSGANLIPILNEGSEGLRDIEDSARKAGIVMSDETAEAAAELSRSMKVLSAYGEGFWVSFASPIVESLAKVATSMRQARDDGDGFFSSMITGWQTLWTGTDKYKNEMEIVRLTTRKLDLENAALKNPYDGWEAELKVVNTELERALGYQRLLTSGLNDLPKIDAFGAWSEPVDIYGQPLSKSGGKPRTTRPGKEVDPDRELMAEFHSAEKFFQSLHELGEIAKEDIEAFYNDWEKIAEDSVPVLMEVELKYSRFLKQDLKEQEAAEEALYKANERTLKNWTAVQEKAYKESDALVRKSQNIIKEQAQEELNSIKDTVYATRNDRIAALEELRQKYHDYGITGEAAEKLIQKEMNRTKSDAQVLSEKMAKMFANDIPDAILKTVGAIKNDLSNEIYSVLTGAKSLGEAVEGFFDAVTKSILKMLADIAANEIMKWLFTGGSGGVGTGFLSSLTSGLDSFFSSITSGTTNIFTKLVDGLSSTASSFFSILDDGLSGALDWFSSGIDSIWEGASSLLGLGTGTGTSLVEDGLYGGAGLVTGSGSGLITGSGAGALAMEEAGLGGGSSLLAGAGALAIPGAMLAAYTLIPGDYERPGDANMVYEKARSNFFLKNAWASSADWTMFLYTDPDVYAAGTPKTENIPRFADQAALIAYARAAPNAWYYFDDISPPVGYATGTDMVVTRPTTFMAGESSAERVTVTPLAGSTQGARGGNVINFNGPAMFDEFTFRQFRRMILENG